ncbi:MAG: hypothetical protein C5B55_09955 [Blastocatellia bacterium]|nr:MAG: hypothetical protein C5B55_09955 [Blastocatellia bacterium]
MSNSFLDTKRLEKLVSTRSTKSSPSKTVRDKAATVNAPVTARGEFSETTWWIGVVAILCLGAVLRLYNLNLVPLHHDEGVNGNFLVRLVRENIYHYDPANYHGPTLYYFAAIIPWVTKLLFGAAARDEYGLTTFNIRLIPALFGLGTIALIFCLRRRLGTVATLSAALFVAVSPGAVYLSRYFIHETQFVFFTLGIVVAGLRFYDERRPHHLILAFVSAALLFATKETAMISAAVLFLALVLTNIYKRLVKRSRVSTKQRKKTQTEAGLGLTELVEEIGGTSTLLLWILLGSVLFVAINIVFYSSFFSNYPQGIYDSLKTFDFWTKTGKAQHVHPPVTYIHWLVFQEAPLLFLGAIGAVFAVLKPKNSFALFSAMWAFGLIAAYSLVPYKTPWLQLNFIIPLAIIAGYAVQTFYQLDLNQLRFAVTVVVIAIGISFYQTIDLNFFNYDNDSEYYVYVYAHTKRDTVQLVNEIDKLAQQNQKNLTGITIVSPDYWPLPWYLRNYSRVGYFAQMTTSNEPIIIASETQKAEMDQRYGELYQLVPSGKGDGGFALRPGVNLLLYERKTSLVNQ